MRTHFHRRVVRFAPSWFTVLALLGGLAGGLFAQETNSPAANPVNTPAFGRVKNFFVPDYYEAPNQNQMKSLLRGAEAEPQPNGRVLIHELQVETYGPDGAIELTVHAPECLYNSVTQTASSASHIEAQSGDGKMFIEGEGFLWEQANSRFTISNRVHTTIRQTSVIAR
jgi:hypothetical protein